MLNRIKAALKVGVAILFGLWPATYVNCAIADTPENSTVIAAIVLNLARFTEWPPSAFAKPNDSIRLCVLGDNTIQDAFSQIDRKQIGARSLSVTPMPRIKSPEQCHLLYTSALDRGTAIQLLAELRNRPIFTVSGDENHFLEDGGMVLLKLADGKMNIEINLNAVNRGGLKVSSRVLQLAKVVNQ